MAKIPLPTVSLLPRPPRRIGNLRFSRRIDSQREPYALASGVAPKMHIAARPAASAVGSFHSLRVRLICFLLASSILTGLLIGASTAADPLDWPNWRGPQQNGTSVETDLVESWNPRGGDGSNLLWKRDDVGGRSTPIVMNGRLYTLVRDQPETPREGEKVVCLDAATGKTIWENRFNVYLSDVPDTRVGWSSCVGDPETNRVYALGVCGLFQCLDGETGDTIWSHSMHEEYGLLSTYGGRTNIPVLFEDLVIVSAVVIGWGDMAKPAHRFLAFNKKTGEVVWFDGTRLLPYDTSYSTPTVTVLGGQRALVFGSGDGAVWAMQPRTGKGIWKYQFSRRGLNVSPLVMGDRVFSSHSEESMGGTSMGALVAINALAKGKPTRTGEMDITEAGRLWQVKERMAGKSSPLPVDGRIIFVDDRATLLVVNPETGEVETKKKLGTVMRSSPLYADGKIYACTANGRWYILRLNGERIEVVHRDRLPSGEECHASPIVSHGRLYLTSTGHLYCIANPEQESSAAAPPPVLDENPVADDPEPAHVQVIPAEVLLKSGGSQQFTVRLFNASGQLLKETEAEFSLDGPGEITSDGKFTTANDKAHTVTIVRVQVEGLNGSARIRVVPDLPWQFDFEDGQVPVTWVARGIVTKTGRWTVVVSSSKSPPFP